MDIGDWREQISRSLRGELSAEDQRALDERLARDPELAEDAADMRAAQEALDSLRETLQPRTPPSEPISREQRLERLFERSHHELPVISAHYKETRALYESLQAGGLSSPSSAPRPRSARPIRMALAAALVAVVGLLAGIAMRSGGGDGPAKPTAAPVVAKVSVRGIPLAVEVRVSGGTWRPVDGTEPLRAQSRVRTLAGGRAVIRRDAAQLELLGDTAVTARADGSFLLHYGALQASAGKNGPALHVFSANGHARLAGGRAQIKQPAANKYPETGARILDDGRVTYRANFVPVAEVLEDASRALNVEFVPADDEVRGRLHIPVSFSCSRVTPEEFRGMLGSSLASRGFSLEGNVVKRSAGSVHVIGWNLFQVKVLDGSATLTDQNDRGAYIVKAGPLPGATGPGFPPVLQTGLTADWPPEKARVEQARGFRLVGIFHGEGGARRARVAYMDGEGNPIGQSDLSVGDRVQIDAGRSGTVAGFVSDGIRVDEDGRSMVVPFSVD